MVSVLLLARDEEENLPACLAALSWCDDIVVVDDESGDRTVDIARGYGARVYTRQFDTFSGQRNWALDSVEWRNEWILHLDADEVVTPELADEIVDAVQQDGYVAFRVPSKMMFMGRWLRHAATYPVYQVRLGRNPGLRFKQVGHGQREDVSQGHVGTLDSPYLHFSLSKGVEEWISKHERYSTHDAEEALREKAATPTGLFKLLSADATRRRRALRRLSYRMPFRPTIRFFYNYVLRGGFLDGYPGLEYCRLLSRYESMISLKMAEITRKGRGRSG